MPNILFIIKYNKRLWHEQWRYFSNWVYENTFIFYNVANPRVLQETSRSDQIVRSVSFAVLSLMINVVPII